jgi:AcrR family transcriptional regulator
MINQDKNTRQVILDAAAELFCDYGYDNVSLKMIAQHAGVAISHPYFYFDSKERLLTAVVKQELTKSHTTIATVIAEGASLRPLEFTGRYFWALSSINKSAAFIIHCALTPKLADQIRGIIHETIPDPLLILEELTKNKRIVDTKATALVLLSLTVMYFLGYERAQLKTAFLEALEAK